MRRHLAEQLCSLHVILPSPLPQLQPDILTLALLDSEFLQATLLFSAACPRPTSLADSSLPARVPGMCLPELHPTEG